MTESAEIDIALGAEELESLFAEIRLYLEVVEAFRGEGHEPHWRHEGPSTEVLR
jgi:hypothetical protein